MNYRVACATLGIPYEPSLQSFTSYSPSRIRKLYYRLCLLHHPDKNPGCSESANRFREVHDAYEFVMNVKESGTDERTADPSCKCPQGYTDILEAFLREMGLDETTAREFPLLFMNDVLPTFVRSAIGAMTTDRLNGLTDILVEYKSVMRIPDHVLSTIGTAIAETLASRTRETELRPTLDDLMDHNVFILHYDDLGTTFFLPMWHQDMHYEVNNVMLTVKSKMPHGGTDDRFHIDPNNDIRVSITRSIAALLDYDDVHIQLDGRDIIIPAHELRTVRSQEYVLPGRGIPRTNAEDIYDISDISDIVVGITLV
jgi:hypothetical protein